MTHSSSDAPSDEELACRARHGCAASFEELVRRYQAPVLHFLRHRGSRTDAEDLLQETFLRAYVNLDRYRDKWRFAVRLFTIARRIGIDHHRRRLVVSESTELDAIQSPGPGPSAIAAQEDDRRCLWDLADLVLSDDERTALWLHYVEDMPIREIATVLDRSWVAVKTMLFRARRRLLPLIREEASEGRAGSSAESQGGRPTAELLGVEVGHG